MLAARMERTGETPLEMFANAEGRVAELLSRSSPTLDMSSRSSWPRTLRPSELDAARFTKTYVDAFRLLAGARRCSSLQ